MLESFANFLSGGIIDKLKKTNDLQSRELETVKSKLLSSNNKVTSLEQSLETAEKEINQKNESIEKLKIEVSTSLASLQTSVTERDKYKADYLQTKEELESKDSEIIDCKNQLQHQEFSLNQFSTEVETLKKENYLLTNQLNEVISKQKADNNNNEIDTEDEDVEVEESEERSDSEHPNATSLNVNELIDRLEILEKEKLIMDDRLAKSERRYENLQTEYSVTNSHIEVYKKRIQELEDELKLLKPEEIISGGNVVSVVDEPVIETADTIKMPSSLEVPKQLTIDKVVDVEDGSEIDAREFFSKSEDEILHMRRTLQDAIILDRPKYVCKYCGQMVKISGRNTQRGRASFFSHLYDSDDCDCKTTTGLSKALINAQKYGEYGESKRHKQTKKIIEDALKDTNSVAKGITDVQKEKTVFGSHPLFRWRRPDIYAKYNDLEIVIEIQLSTTFASVIAEREMFYKMNNIFLIWVFNFAQNEEHVDLRNLMMKDIYFENRRNVFVLDREAYEEGLKRKELVLKCDWLEANGKWHYSGEENYGCKGTFVTLSDLTYNKSTYKPYYHDISEEQGQPTYDQNTCNQETETKTIIDLLDKKYEKILQRQQQEELKRKVILDALDVDNVEHEYVRLKVATVKKDSLFGLYNFVEQKEILPAVYRSIKLWNNSRFFLVEDEQIRFGLVNSKGEPVVPLEYVSISKPENGVAIGIYKDEETGCKMSSFINLYRDDSFNISKGFLNLEETKDGIYISTKSHKGLYLKGLVSKTGHVIAENVYTTISVFSDKLYIAVLNGKYGLLNDKGEKVLSFKYDRISQPVEGRAEIVLNDNTDYLDSEGKYICDARRTVKATLGTEKRKFLNEWRVFDKNNKDLSKQGYEEICHYQGHIVSFSSNKIVSDKNIWADMDCGIEAELTEKTKTGLLFKFGNRIAKMNKRQLQRKPEGIMYEKGKTYTVYISCIKEDLNLIYLSPVPCFGPATHSNKKRTSYSYKRYK